MGRWGWKMLAVGLALLSGAFGGPTGIVPVVSSAAAASITSAAPSCPPTEPSSGPFCDKEVLLAARDTLQGVNTEALHTWQRDHPIASFEGVRVDPSSGRVVAIEDAWPTFLIGSIPEALGQLGHLQVLDLGGNGLTGTIPPELGQLDQLQVLRLGRNQLTGPMPKSLGQLGHLQVLHLTDNQLTGAVLPELGQLDQLQTLDLSRNQLTGAIPPPGTGTTRPTASTEFGRQPVDGNHSGKTGTAQPTAKPEFELQPVDRAHPPRTENWDCSAGCKAWICATTC